MGSYYYRAFSEPRAEQTGAPEHVIESCAQGIKQWLDYGFGNEEQEHRDALIIALLGLRCGVPVGCRVLSEQAAELLVQTLKLYYPVLDRGSEEYQGMLAELEGRPNQWF